jgi:diacylglycerol O-acyltransferase / wax synthase
MRWRPLARSPRAWSRPPPRTPLNQACGSHRRVSWVHADLADLKAVKNVLGGTVNDVFLNVVSGALQRWLHTRGHRTEGLELRGAVPVSVRAEDGAPPALSAEASLRA